MPRYVVLRHETESGSHWDFMLQRGPALSTWALPQAPDSAQPVIAESLPDHRLTYLDYEGPLSGGRGAVSRWDRGTFEIEQETSTELRVNLIGERLCGRVCLRRLPDQPQRWQFSYAPAPRPDAT